MTCISLSEIVTFEKIQGEPDERFGDGSAFLPILMKLTTAKMLSGDNLSKSGSTILSASSDLLRVLAKVDEAGAGFKSLTESIDTRQPAGSLMMNMLGSFKQFGVTSFRQRSKPRQSK